MTIQAVGIIVLIIGVVLELFGVGSEESFGTIIAVIGIALFVFGMTQKKRS